MMNDDNIPEKFSSIRDNNYLVNAYKYVIKVELTHFITALIETILNIIQELNIFLHKNNSDFNCNHHFLDSILRFQNEINDLSTLIRLIILLVISSFFNMLYLFLSKKKFHRKSRSLSLLFNLLELFYFRIFMLVSLNIFFSLHYIYFFLLLVFFVPHLFLIKDHFLYNHLYYFVPVIIKYPFDEFSSIYDLILLFIKICLSIIINATNRSLQIFSYLLLFIMQIIICFYFINLMHNHSYLFMKNKFLNISKISLFFTQTFAIIIAEIVGQSEIINIYFVFIITGLFVFLLLYINLVYEPLCYIKIKTETPLENLLFYFHIISHKNELNFLLEKKINEHYEKCGICSLCIKFRKYLNSIKFKINDNNNIENLVNTKRIKEENKLISLFKVLYEYNNNFFPIINEIVLNYKYNKEKIFINSSYYYINLSFLIYSEFKINHITLSLNIKLLLDIINQENKIDIDNHEFHINQIMFCNKFISLSNKILNKLKDILTDDYINAKKYIELSRYLKEMQKSQFKDILYNYKPDNSSSLRIMILICSILYEEIFNITINSSQLPIRDNYQILDDIFFNNKTKNDKIITLAINLINNDCKIIRAGKGLYKYKDYNLFDLFPLTFKDQQIKLFLSKILESFNSDINKIDVEKAGHTTRRKTKKNIKDNKAFIKDKIEYIEIKLIISEEVSSKMYSKLLILKLTPLFNCDFNSYFLLFDGKFNLYKNTIMTLQDVESNHMKEQKIISVSNPELEEPPEIYTMKYAKYSIWLDKIGFILSKLIELNFSSKIYSVYSIIPKDNTEYKKNRRYSFYRRESTSDIGFSEMKSGPEIKSQFQHLIEENVSIISQPISNNYTASGYGIKTKKKENMYRYSSLYKIKNTLVLSIPIIVLLYVLEVYHLNKLKNENINNDYSILKFNEIYKIYFQLFTTSLSVACIKTSDGCKSISTNYILDYDKFSYFNLSSFLMAQNKFLSKELLLKKNNLVNIHKNIGNKKYKEIFEEKVDYIRIGKIFVNGHLTLVLYNVTMPFSDAILLACNSFQTIVNNTKNESVYILNKKINPLPYLSEEEVEFFSDYRKEISEMILNYKIFKDNFININQKFVDILASQSQKIELFVYLYICLTMLICLYILGLLYMYLFKFEQIIIKILNYVNMVRNFKNEKYNFSSLFLQKIENLKTILNIYSDDSIKAIQELCSLYNKYYKYKAKDNRNYSYKIIKKDYKKIIEKEDKKDDLDTVPINQRIFKKEDIRKLNIMYYYFLVFVFINICIVIVFIIFIFLWINYSKIKTNLYSLISKNLQLEISLYKAINLYDLIIFNNFTIEELSQDIFYAPDKNIYNWGTLLNSLYDDLFIAFNYESEITVLRESFKNFPFFLFTCENLYEENREFLYELENYSSFNNMSALEHDLIEICNFSRVAEFNDMNALFQSHYQNIKNAILSINDHSHEGLINHLNEGKLGKIQIHFNCILIYILNLISNKMHKTEISFLILRLKTNLSVTLIASLLSYLILILIVRLAYIRKLKQFCNQIILLKKIFKIYDIQEQ